ncbi:MAG: elongation factor Ts [candidate division Zixibacteria bacterium]|nr:elongation factor Ts [candidate division Zixibacteria bacterium]
MDISAQMVKELRDQTGAGMMDCKKALTEAAGNFERAVTVLRERGIAKAASKEGRTTSEGLIVSHIQPDGKLGVMVEINCETDFVARTDKFRDFVSAIAKHVAGSSASDVDGLLNEKTGNGKTVSDLLKETIGSIGENMQIKRFVRFSTDGQLTNYIHPGDKLGVMVEIAVGSGAAGKDGFRVFARDIAMQIAATNPLAVTRDGLDQTMVAKERDILRHQTENEKKPAAVIDKIVEGRMEKYYSEVVLMEQPFVKDNDKTIRDVVAEKVAALGEPLQVKRFVRFRLGE